AVLAVPGAQQLALGQGHRRLQRAVLVRRDGIGQKRGAVAVAQEDEEVEVGGDLLAAADLLEADTEGALRPDGLPAHPQRRSSGWKRIPCARHSSRKRGKTRCCITVRSVWKSAKVELTKRRMVVPSSSAGSGLARELVDGCGAECSIARPLFP